MTITTGMVYSILEFLTDVAVPVAGFDWPEKSTINIAVLMTGDSTHESPVFLLSCTGTVEKRCRRLRRAPRTVSLQFTQRVSQPLLIL
jgi:hypothetical protein